MSFTGKSKANLNQQLPSDAEDISDIIGIVSPFETPLLAHLGDADRTADSGVHTWEYGIAGVHGHGRNLVQTFTAGVDVSRSMQASRAYGMADELDYQKQERTRELLRDLENCVINGVASPSGESEPTAIRPSMGGIIHNLHTNILNAQTQELVKGTEFTRRHLDALTYMVSLDSPGQAETIVLGGAQKRRMNEFDNVTKIDNGEAIYENDHGIYRVILCRWVPKDTVLVLDSSLIKVLPLAGCSFHYKTLASTGDSTSGQVVGRYTMELSAESAHGLIRGLSL